MTRLALPLAAALLAAVVLGGTAALRPVAAQTEQISGDVPAGGGFGLVVWSGGNVNAIPNAALQRQCTAVSVFATQAGQLTGFIFGAPEFVNRPFTTAFPQGNLPGGVPLILVCRGATPPPPPPPPPPPSNYNAELSRLVADQINQARAQRGLPGLRIDDRLNRAAGDYSAFLFESGNLRSIDQAGRSDIHNLNGTHTQRAQGAGYPHGVGETIAFRIQDPRPAGEIAPLIIQAWVNSPVHNAIMFSRDFQWRDVGAGCYRDPASEAGAINCVAMFGLGG